MAKSWTDEQISVIEQKNSNLLVAAAAGSGKTAVMVERIIRRVLDEKNPLDIDRIVVVTFTKAAATQMRERIAAALSSVLISQKDERRIRNIRKQLALLDNAVICTIDSFCNYILRNYFNTIDLDPSYRIGDEGELKLLMSDVADEVIEEAYSDGEKAFLEFVDGQLPAKSDNKLSEWIISLYTFSQSHPYPGEWLRECKKWYNITTAEEFEKSAVVEFIKAHIKNLLRAAIDEYKDMIEQLESEGGIEKYIPAFNSDLACFMDAYDAGSYSELRKKLVFKFERLANAPKDADEELKNNAKALRDRQKKIIGKLSEELLFWSVEDNLDMIKSMAPSANAFIDLVISFEERYSCKKSENNILSFSDVEHLALQVLRSPEGLTHAAKELSSLYEEIYIDEYQDSNMVQELILTSVSRGNNIFMVGDIKQSIYSFRQADPGIFLEKYNSYSEDKESDNVLICLHKNFRSRANVLYAVNDIFKDIMHAQLGGVEYDIDAQLVPGKVFKEPDAQDIQNAGEQDTDVELLLCRIPKSGEDEQDEKGKREYEAETIAERIKLLTDRQPQPIWDESLNGGSGGYRSACYRDIVILLRSANVAGPEYARVLNDAGIPAVCSTAYGYFSTPEIVEILNILRVIDNPRQDIALAGAMRSYFCYLTAQELAILKNSSEKTDLYTAVIKYCDGKDNENYDKELADKIDRFLSFLDEYRKKASYTPIHELIKELIYNTQYIVYAASKKNGKRRMANLDMLVDKAAEYEKTSFHGLFNFLRYIDKIQKYEIDMGEADTMSENDDVVRIMSIHKSKGLEFPIVFVADMEKKYNLRETAEKVNFHVGFGMGLDMVDTTLRVRKKSFHKRAMAESIKVNSIGEELRVLYVALTRAVEKLILVGGASNTDGLIEEWRRRAESSGGDYSYVYNSTNYLDLVAPVFFKKITASQLSFRLITYSQNENSENVNGRLNNFPEKSLEEHQKDSIADDIYMFHNEEFFENNGIQADDKLADIFRERFNFVYPHELSVHLPNKFSVSELKHQKIDESEDEAVHIVQIKKDKPVMTGGQDSEDRKKNMGAERGNAYHKVFELFDYNVENDEKSIREFIHGLVLSGRMDEEYERLVNPRKYIEFLNTQLGQRMKKAALSGKMYRERQFITGFPAQKIKPEYAGCDDIIMVQGIIDCCFEENGEYVIVDYKTDHVENENAEDILRKRYTEQLKLYSDALRQISNVKVKECTIYSVSVSREIKL